MGCFVRFVACDRWEISSNCFMFISTSMVIIYTYVKRAGIFETYNAYFRDQIQNYASVLSGDRANPKMTAALPVVGLI